MVTTGTPVTGFGLLTANFIAPLRTLVATLSQHIDKYLRDHDSGQCAELRWHEVTMRHALSRLTLMPSTYPDQVLQVVELQRHWLMALGFLEYQRRTRDLSTIWQGLSCHELDLIGAWTSDPQTVQTLYAANIPVWFVRNMHLLHDDIRIASWPARILPTFLCMERFPGVDSELFHGLVGESHLSSMMQGGHGYLDISRVPSAAIYTISDFSGAVSIRQAKSLSRMGPQSASSSQPAPRVTSQAAPSLPPSRMRRKPCEFGKRFA